MIRVDKIYSPISSRMAFTYVERAVISVDEGRVMFNSTSVPVAMFSAIMMGPGTSVTHAALKTIARCNTALFAVGGNGTKLYASFPPSSGNNDRLRHQATMYADSKASLKVARSMFAIRFGEESKLTKFKLNQLRGLEGLRVRKRYQELSKEHGFSWFGRKHDSSDTVNSCISWGCNALYNLAETALVAIGYSPDLGFVHLAKRRSFAYDVADLIKFETVVPEAFKIASLMPSNPERAMRRHLAVYCTKNKILEKLIVAADQSTGYSK